MISRTQELILQLLLDPKGTYGLEMVRQSAGRIKRGTVYVTLQRMEQKGLVESWEEDGPGGEHGPRRRLYRIAGKGVEALKEIQSAQLIKGGEYA